MTRIPKEMSREAGSIDLRERGFDEAQAAQVCPRLATLVEEIRNLRTASPDYNETERLKRDFSRLRSARRPFYLTGAELMQIFRWKLGSQYGRVATQLAANSEEAYRAVTEAVFKFTYAHIEHEIEIRIGLLRALRGVGIPVASAVLALVEPTRYCVIAFRGWRALFEEERRTFSVTHYVLYRGKIEELARALGGWTVQETDLAVWEYDRRST